MIPLTPSVHDAAGRQAGARRSTERHD